MSSDLPPDPESTASPAQAPDETRPAQPVPDQAPQGAGTGSVARPDDWPPELRLVLAAAFALPALGAAWWGLARLRARPDLWWDYALGFAIAAACAWLAWRQLARYRIARAAGDAARAGALPEPVTGTPQAAAPQAAPEAPAPAIPDSAPAPGATPPDIPSTTLGVSDRVPGPAPLEASADRAAGLTASLLATGLFLVLLGQVRMDMSHQATGGTVLLFLAGVALWLWALRRHPEPALDPVADALLAERGPPLDRRRRQMLVAAILLALLVGFAAPAVGGGIGSRLGILSYPGGANNSLTVLGGGLWIAAIGLLLAALGGWDGLGARWRRVWDGEALSLRVGRTALGVMAITALGAWYRFRDLGRLPYEMTSDHTEKLFDIATITGEPFLRPVFLPANAGREPMEFYWIAFLVMLGLPLTFMTMKIGMALVSTATIPPIYRLGREVGTRELGLVAALIFALAPWHLQITRIGLRIAFAPLWVALTLIFLYRGLTRGRRNDWLAVGTCLGLGMYGYTAFRPMILAVPLVIAARILHDAWHLRRAQPGRPLVSRPLVGHLAAAGLLALAWVLPLIRYAIDQKDAFLGRTLSRVTTSEVQVFENPPLLQFFINLKNALLMVNLTSDSAWFQSPPSRPALETVGGALFVLGLAVALHKVLRRDWRVGTLVLIIPVMLLSTIMALAFPLENPSLSRASAALPMVVVVAALPLPVLGARWRQAWGKTGAGAYAALLALLLAWMAAGTSQRYFNEYRAGYDGSTHPTFEVAEVVRGFLRHGGDLGHAYYIGWPNGWDYRAIGLALGEPNWSELLQGTKDDWSDAAEGARGHRGDPARKLYLVGGPFAQQNLALLRELYPEGIVTRHPGHFEGKEFWSVFVPGTTSEPSP